MVCYELYYNFIKKVKNFETKIYLVLESICLSRNPLVLEKFQLGKGRNFYLVCPEFMGLVGTHMPSKRLAP